MNYNRAERFFKWIANYRSKMRGYQKEATDKIEKIKRYSDSANFAEAAEEIENEKMQKVRALQTATKSEISEIIEGMQRAAEKAKTIFPTQEQKLMLDMLKMKETISTDEIKQAGEAVKDCPLAASIVDELASKNGHPGYRVPVSIMDKNEALRIIDGLSSFASTTLSMDEVDCRQKWLKSPQYDPEADPKGRNTKAFTADRDFGNAREMVGFAGNTDRFDQFCEVVDF